MVTARIQSTRLDARFFTFYFSIFTFLSYLHLHDWKVSFTPPNLL
ncbi:hypothetical protein SAMN05444682_1017 [Parapedobacter indicus]|uniref:Uncharacterized protein n=1 Tax=Parapedobacter indicus TaxID=1477437 RepID=A0A1I3CG55_9SPHI|nr:hypothetical protein CLV26_10120 [Parapedobacter indicus]SFH73061.1 hypothetical protein SAMN05444682_1017 [Parapedobacter indicus]